MTLAVKDYLGINTTTRLLRASNAFWLILLFVIAEMIVKPLGNFPLNDDWSYAKSVLMLQTEHKIDIGTWPAMTLATQLVWGGLFTSVFGFSFTVLRFSTLVSSLIGVLVLNKLVFRISGSKIKAFIAALSLLFNPFYFNLSNTFMTDVNFNTLLLLAVYFIYDFFQAPKKRSFFLVFFLSTLLVLLRQYGIILPVCFLVSCVFLTEKRWVYVFLSGLLLAMVLLVLKYYELYLKGILPDTAAYKFSGKVNPTQRVFWDILLLNTKSRYTRIIFHTLFYSFPFTLLLVKPVLEEFNKKKIMLLFVFTLIPVYVVFKDSGFQMPNVFTDLAVGTETFFQTLKGTDSGYGHTYNKYFELLMPYVECVFISISLTVLILYFYKTRRKIHLKDKPELIFLWGLFICYAIMIIITESYFDRYHIPLISLCLLLLSYIKIPILKTSPLSTGLLLLLFYVSVFGTKDYLTLHRTNWEAYQDLRKDKTLIKAEEINAGFEVYCWNDGKHVWWWEFLSITNFNYIIQYDPEPGFVLLKEYSFQRYFPYKKDKINIFARIDKKK